MNPVRNFYNIFSLSVIKAEGEFAVGLDLKFSPAEFLTG